VLSSASNIKIMGVWRNWVGYPGQRNKVSHKVKTIKPLDFNSLDEKNPDLYVEAHDEVGFNGCRKTGFDRVLDYLVWAMGSKAAFFLMWIILIIWIIVGIVFHAPFNWQVIMQDGQSIQTYIWDTFLMRQQLVHSFHQNLVWAEFESRTATFRRLLRTVDIEKSSSFVEETKSECSSNEISVELPTEDWFDRMSSWLTEFVGSLTAVVIYWSGIIIWIGCGAIPSNAQNDPPFTGVTTGSNPQKKPFSDTWQLYINTAVAVHLLITSVFLQNARERHDQFVRHMLDHILHLDYAIESKLRSLSDDLEPNEEQVLVPEKRNKVLHAIDWYSDIIGTGIGGVIAIIVIVIWIIIGGPMGWSDNWWLIIGTYTGLVGFIDGFVLRNVYNRIVIRDQSIYEKCREKERTFFEEVGLPWPESAPEPNKTISYRISAFINVKCSTTSAVGVSILIIVGLIACACGLRWNTTAQLICNSPTMIIEGFFLIILLQAHKWADVKTRTETSALCMRRSTLNTFVQSL